MSKSFCPAEVEDDVDILLTRADQLQEKSRKSRKSKKSNRVIASQKSCLKKLFKTMEMGEFNPDTASEAEMREFIKEQQHKQEIAETIRPILVEKIKLEQKNESLKQELEQLKVQGRQAFCDLSRRINHAEAKAKKAKAAALAKKSTEISHYVRNQLEQQAQMQLMYGSGMQIGFGGGGDMFGGSGMCGGLGGGYQPNLQLLSILGSKH